jgi:hypothetical protein
MNGCHFNEEEYKNNHILKCKRKSLGKKKSLGPIKVNYTIQDFIVVNYFDGIRPVDNKGNPKTCCSSCYRHHNGDKHLLEEKSEYLKWFEKTILE